MKVRVTNIQRFCLSDGPGIRTVVFLKGCNLKCPWCANPENINFLIEKYIKNEKVGIYGKDMDIDEVFECIMKDKKYYLKNSGGVTFSGGEPLLQASSLMLLLKMLKKENIHITIESALMVSTSLLELVISYIDYFIVDIKILDKIKANEVLGGDISLYYKNLEILNKYKKNYSFRIPLVKGYTLESYNLNKIIDLLKKYKSNSVEIFKVHDLALSKYKSLGMEMECFDEISDDEVKYVYDRLKNEGIKVDIIKL